MNVERESVKLYFDGGARPNPGMAYGSYEVQSNGLNHRSIRRQFGSPYTNNQAEYLALIAGLKWLVHNAHPNTPVMVFTDSQLVARQLTGRYRVKVPHIKELWSEARSLLDNFSWQIKWRGREHNVRRFGH